MCWKGGGELFGKDHCGQKLSLIKLFSHPQPPIIIDTVVGMGRDLL